MKGHQRLKKRYSNFFTWRKRAHRLSYPLPFYLVFQGRMTRSPSSKEIARGFISLGSHRNFSDEVGWKVRGCSWSRGMRGGCSCCSACLNSPSSFCFGLRQAPNRQACSLFSISIRLIVPVAGCMTYTRLKRVATLYTRRRRRRKRRRKKQKEEKNSDTRGAACLRDWSGLIGWTLTGLDRTCYGTSLAHPPTNYPIQLLVIFAANPSRSFLYENLYILACILHR